MAALFGRYQGVLKCEFSLGGPMYVDTIEHLLVNILGDRATTGAADPYTHATALLNSGQGQPKTHTLTHATGIPAGTGARVYASSALSELTIKYNAESELCTYEAKGTSWGSAIASVAPTAAPSAVPPMASWRGLLGLAGPAGGGTLVPTMAESEVTLKRKLDALYTVSGSQQPYIIQRGELEFSGKITFIAADETPLTKMLASTQEQLQILLGNGVTGAGQRSLTIDCAQGAYSSAKIDQGKTASMYEVEFDGIANSTNAGTSGGLSPCKITVINGNAGTIY
jgi:hypothetical protein